MRNRLIVVAAVLSAVGPANARADEGNEHYPLRFEIEVYPETVYYGDVAFVSITLVNQSDRPILVPEDYHTHNRQENACAGPAFTLLYRDERMLDYLSGGLYARREGGAYHPPERNEDMSGPSYPCRELAPGERFEIEFMPIWIPQHEFADFEDTKRFKEKVEESNGGEGFVLKGPYGLPEGYGAGYKGPLVYPVHIMPERASDPLLAGIETPIHVHPRSDEELALLREWYLEIPEFAEHPFQLGVFPHYYHCRGSIFAASPEEYKNPVALGKRRYEIPERRKERLIDSLKSLSPQSERRVVRVEKLERELLKLARSRGETISRNMEEFIRLRGFLVEIRYAPTAEDGLAAFDAMLFRIEQSQTPELWVKYLRRIVLDDYHHTHVLGTTTHPLYRRMLDERFPPKEDDESEASPK